MHDPSHLAFIAIWKRVSPRLQQYVTIKFDFASASDLRQIRSASKKAKALDEKSKLAGPILRVYLDEIAYHRRQGSLATNWSGFLALKNCQLSEIGVPLVFRHEKNVTAVAFLHVTWKGNVYLDWMTKLPRYFELEYHIEKLAHYLMRGIMAWSGQMNAQLLFIESKKDAAAFYKKMFKLKRERDFILLSRTFQSNPRRWKVLS
jgi:hypothetical protein